jgi:hypothetical protein
MYLTYEEYQNMGGTLSESIFNDFEYEAETQIDWYTFNRLHGEETYPEAVKRCMYHLIKLLQQKAEALVVGGTSADGGIVAGVASQSNDGVSISFNTLSAKDMVALAGDEVRKCINGYLQGVVNSLGRKLLYRGLYEDE